MAICRVEHQTRLKSEVSMLLRLFVNKWTDLSALGLNDNQIKHVLSSYNGRWGPHLPNGTTRLYAGD